jgi:hypothetical protein
VSVVGLRGESKGAKGGGGKGKGMGGSGWEGGESVQVGINGSEQKWTEEIETRCGRERVESSRNEMR